jgi:hypothetical protein
MTAMPRSAASGSKTIGDAAAVERVVHLHDVELFNFHDLFERRILLKSDDVVSVDVADLAGLFQLAQICQLVGVL